MSRKMSKRFKKAVKGVNRLAAMPVADAVAQVKARASAKFVESVDLAVKLNIDTKQSDQLVRGSLALPHGIGKSMRVAAFADGEMAKQAEEAGAVAVGGQELADKIAGGWMEFDVVVCHPSMMRFVGKLGKVLGPKGLMPSPKSGTVTDKLVDAVREFGAGKLEFRNDKEGNIHMIVGKVDFPDEKLVENIQAALGHLRSIRPAAVRGDYMTGAYISSTMGPGFKLALGGESAPSA